VLRPHFGQHRRQVEIALVERRSGDALPAAVERLDMRQRIGLGAQMRAFDEIRDDNAVADAEAAVA
jgi:hypothetical protein